MSRRALLASAVGGAAAVALGACARGSQTRPQPGHLVSLFNDNPTWVPGYQAAGAQLRKLTGYDLSPRAVPNVSNYQQIVRMSAQTDSSSDLLKWWNGYRLIDVARAGMLVDVSDAWREAAGRGWTDDRVLRDSFSYQGRQYGVPLYKSYYAVLYSKKTFRALGVTPPSTWDEFLHVIDAAKRRKITPIALGGGTGANAWESQIWFQQLVNGLDHGFYQRLTAGQASYTDPVCRRAMQLWIDLFQRGAFSLPDLASADVPGKFTAGKIAMQLYGTWNIGAFLAAGIPDGDLGAFLVPPPPGGNQSVVVESAVLAVSAKAHKPDAARAIARAWLNPAVQTAWTGFLKDSSADPSVVPAVGAVRQVAAEVRRLRPSQAIRYWESSPPVLVEGNVQDLSAFVIDPTPANATKTLSSMQNRADTEWRVWRS